MRPFGEEATTLNKAVNHNFITWVSAMMPVALFSLFFGTEDACLPVGREDVLKVIGRTPDFQLCPNYILTYWQSSVQS
jgi:hypothetical protein